MRGSLRTINFNLRLPLDKTINNRCSCRGVPLKAKSSYSKVNISSFAQVPTPSPTCQPSVGQGNDGFRGLDSPQMRYINFKLMSENEAEVQEDGANKDIKYPFTPSFLESDDPDVESNKTPNHTRGNRFFGIPLTDSNSPRWSHKTQRKSPLERTEFASDSVATDARGRVEAEGDTILQHLNKQVHLDRKSLIELYMELDEERSASTIAANNAMAMITRLQAEKAAVQMEALQCQRMMEEDAEYDQEALRSAYDMIEKREEEINLLEAEVNAYREKYGALPDFSYRAFREEDYPEFQSQFQSSHSFKPDRPSSPMIFNRRENVEDSVPDNDQVSTPLSFSNRGGKSQLLGRMKKLERRVISSSVENLSFNTNGDNINITDNKNETG